MRTSRSDVKVAAATCSGATASLPSHWIFAVDEAKAHASSDVKVTAAIALTDARRPEEVMMLMCACSNAV